MKNEVLPVVLIPHPHVRVDPAVLGGSPHVTNSRVPVRRIFGFYRDGSKVETIMRRFPQLGAARVLDAIAFALDNPEVMEADAARESAFLASAGVKAVRNSRAGSQMSLRFDDQDRKENATPCIGTNLCKSLK